MLAEVKKCTSSNLCEFKSVMARYFGKDYGFHPFPVSVMDGNVVKGAGYVDMEQLYYLAFGNHAIQFLALMFGG